MCANLYFGRRHSQVAQLSKIRLVKKPKPAAPLIILKRAGKQWAKVGAMWPLCSQPAVADPRTTCTHHVSSSLSFNCEQEFVCPLVWGSGEFCARRSLTTQPARSSSSLITARRITWSSQRGLGSRIGQDSSKRKKEKASCDKITGGLWKRCAKNHATTESGSKGSNRYRECR